MPKYGRVDNISSIFAQKRIIKGEGFIYVEVSLMQKVLRIASALAASFGTSTVPNKKMFVGSGKDSETVWIHP